MRARGNCPYCHVDVALAGGPRTRTVNRIDPKTGRRIQERFHDPYRVPSHRIGAVLDAAGRPRRPAIGDADKVVEIECPGVGAKVRPYSLASVE